MGRFPNLHTIISPQDVGSRKQKDGTMYGLKTSLAAFMLLGVLFMGETVEAQGVVPGGWSSQFGYQPLGGPSPGAGFGQGGGGAYPGFSPYSVGGLPPNFTPLNLPGTAPIAPYGYSQSQTFPNGFGFSPGMPQTSSSTDPLTNVISRSVRRAKRR